MEQDKVRSAQARIVEDRFEQQWIHAVNGEVAASSGHSMQMNRHAEAAAFRGDIAKQEILQELVIVRVGRAAANPASVNVLRLGAWRIAEIERAQIRHFKFLGDRSTGLLAFERGRDHLGQVGIQGGRRR